MSLRIAVLGTTGSVGREIVSTLAERDFPCDEVIALASRKSMGKEVSFGDVSLRAKDAEAFDFSTVQLVILAVGERAARKWAPRIASAGGVVIDVSPAFRMDADVPLIAPEANIDAVAGWEKRRILAVPGGVSAMLAAVLKPLSTAAGVKRAVIATYHSASEAGRRAMDELWTQTKGIYVNQAPEPKEFPRQIAFNVIPQVGEIRDDGTTDEEHRIREEIRKVLGTGIEIAATCVQTPVFVGHAAAVHLELERPFSAAAARACLREAPGLMVVDRREEEVYVTPIECVGEWATYVSRIREDASAPNGLGMWVAADNLRKAGALNAILVAEKLIGLGALPSPKT